MVKEILSLLFRMDEKILKIVNFGLLISLLLGLIGIMLVLTYDTYQVKYDFYRAGYILIQTSFVFAAQFIGCGMVFEKILNREI